VLDWQLAEPQQVLVGELVQQLARLVQQQVLLAQLEQPQESLESLLEKPQLEWLVLPRLRQQLPARLQQLRSRPPAP
jgi:hypothetical protein